MHLHVHAVDQIKCSMIQKKIEFINLKGVDLGFFFLVFYLTQMIYYWVLITKILIILIDFLKFSLIGLYLLIIIFMLFSTIEHSGHRSPS